MLVQLQSDEEILHRGPSSRVRLRLLDGFHLDHDGRGMNVPHSGRRLLAYLGVHGRTGRVEIAGTLWPEVVEAKAHASLRTVLWRLQRLAPGTLVAGRETVSLDPDVNVDVRAFIAAARRVLGGGDPAEPLPPLAGMGELLPGWYEDWVLFERERLRQLHMHALEALATRLTRAGRYAEAIEAALAAVRLEPLRESANRALIGAYLAENNVVEAIRRFQVFRDELANELGAQPTPDLERLVYQRHGYHSSP